MKIIDGTSENFTNEVLKSSVPVLVDFNASWCPPCQALHPILEELAEDDGEYKIIAIDIDDQPDLADQYDVSSIPCVVIFKNGEETARKVGLQSKKRLIKMLGV